MSQQPLLAAREQAERSEPAVRAAALMHIARVAARTRQADAEELLKEGIRLATALDSDAASLLLGNAVYLVAAVSPKQAIAHLWNTFNTRGLCPECQYQWEVTACPQCGEMSPHADWYVAQ
jgi:hypothetical protein